MFSIVAMTLVVCAPGYPGTSAEAQPAMDALAKALGPGSIRAVYDETEGGGLRRLRDRDAALLLAPLPFLLAHERELKLVPRLSAVPRGGQPLERWTLVTGKDRPPNLDGYAVQSIAGFSPRFVRAMAPGLAANVRIGFGSSVLTALRRAASGEKIAVLLDGTQTAALQGLPFASSLAIVRTSPPVPVALVAWVDKRLDERRWKPLEARFLHLGDDPAAREALEGVRMSGFVPLDESALAAARAAWRRAR